ncbi:MAG: methyltransferase domain-containing protein [Rhodocyclaceae bacterium]|nr:methyltransferase domain-containing protein [Rhodocyclaceae bacterium]MBX3667309.1 methyltransferase domain-containing protein [Rhodocyclaceae bacterium]
MSWDPSLYLSFADLRLRPALDLLARIHLSAPARVADLGCGAGNVTAWLARRWPHAAITGVDNSAAMLASAQASLPRADWELADLATWQPAEQFDLVYSNAALHWLDGHQTLFPRLVRAVRPGGVLAIQMPNNFGSPSHLSAHAAALDGPWAERLRPLLRERPVLPPADYYDLLAPLGKSVDIWETEYMHILDGDNPVADWNKGALLVPLLGALDEPHKTGFEARYRELVAAAYTRRPDGKTLFPFRRLFIVLQTPDV